MKLWDSALRWHAVCFQEILGDDDKNSSDDDGPRIVRDFSGGRHALVLGPPRRGTGGGRVAGLRVGIAIHHRRAKHICAATSAQRSVSVLLKTPTMCLQIVFVHLPSHFNSTPEEYDFHVQERGSLLRGTRRHRILVGVDPNIQTDNSNRDANLVGGAISRTTTPQAAERDSATSLLAQTQAHGLRFMNTSENLHSAEDQRHTWDGPIFGHRSSQTIDYILADGTTAQLLSSSLVRRRMPCPSDHAVWGLSLDLALRLHLPPRRRATKKAWLVALKPRAVPQDLPANMATTETLGKT